MPCVFSGSAPTTVLVLLLQVAGHTAEPQNTNDAQVEDPSVGLLASWLSDRGADLGNVKAAAVQTGPKGWLQADRSLRAHRGIGAGEVIMTGV